MRTGIPRKRRGSTMLEFVLVGIPVIFIMISLFDTARGMWVYHTLSYSVREATRYASVHGIGCKAPQTCQITIGQIVTRIKNTGVGLDPSAVTATFTPAVGSATSGTLASLASSTAIFPPNTANSTGQTLQISLVYPFKTILAIFWVGDGRPINDSQTFHLGASSKVQIQY